MLAQKKQAVRKAFLRLAFAAGIGASASASASPQTAPTLDFTVLRTLPHDVRHFTQGLLIHGGRLYESAGGYGESAVYEKDLATGEVLRSSALPREVFAEGLALFGGEFFLLTWRNGLALVFDQDLREQRRLRYRGEGWGLTHDGAHLVMSDGSHRLRWMDPTSWKALRTVTVRDGQRTLHWLNELESARGWIFANIWHSDRVAAIDPADGAVQAWLDLSALRKRFPRPKGWDEREHVLNGIAYDAAQDLFYVTGKRWPTLFEIRIDWPQGRATPTE
jgi:glutaminyl-peptide cyclotransferase